MVIMLNDVQVQNIKDIGKIVFSTVSNDGYPRSIWVMPSMINKDTIILSNIQMHKSIENIRNNKKCFINVYFPDKDDLQYKIQGTANIINKGKLFRQIKKFEETNNLPPELKVSDIIVITIEQFEESNG